LLRGCDPQRPAPRACETALVTSGHVVGLLRATGRLTVTSTVRIGASHPGQVVAVDATVGARVSKGQIIARSTTPIREPPPWAPERSSRRRSCSSCAPRRPSSTSSRPGARRGRFRVARSGRAARRQGGEAQLELLHTETEVTRRNAALTLANKLLARRVIRAPMDGVVLERNVEAGESIPASPPGPPLFVIGADPAALGWRSRSTNATSAASCPAVDVHRACHGAYAFSGTIRERDPGAAAVRSPRRIWSRSTSPIGTARWPGHVGGRRPSRRHRPRRARGAERALPSRRTAIQAALVSKTTTAAPKRSPSRSASPTPTDRGHGPRRRRGAHGRHGCLALDLPVGPLPRSFAAPRPERHMLRAATCGAQSLREWRGGARGLVRARRLLCSRRMKTLHSVLALGLAATCLSFPAQAAKPAAACAAAASSSIDVWIRGGGPLQGDSPPRARSQAVNLDALPLVDSQRFDAQYGASHAFRGIPLANVIASFAPDPALDVAILHFANGMAVPLPFRDAAVMKRLDPFIARGMETHAKGPVRAAFFTEIRRKGSTEDPRSDRVLRQQARRRACCGNPAVAAAAQPAFSPCGTPTT
jgi:biotin carboxyl carrier protein